MGESQPVNILELANSDILVAGRGKSVVRSTTSKRPFLARLTASGAVIWANGYDIGSAGKHADLTEAI